jgi:hypothetical protein
LKDLLFFWFREGMTNLTGSDPTQRLFADQAACQGDSENKSVDSDRILTPLAALKTHLMYCAAKKR